MQRLHKSVKISEEFGLSSEREAVREYSFLNQNIMSVNYPLIADEIFSKIPLPASILDIGTGTGALAIAFAKRAKKSFILGVDFSSSMLKEAENNAKKEGVSNIEFKLADAHTLPFPDEAFELIVSFGVLHHLDNLKQAFGEIKRLLKEGKSAFLYDLRKDAPLDVVCQIAQAMSPLHRRGFLESVKEAKTIEEMEAILEGLEVREYKINKPSYSRKTILKNKEPLRNSRLFGERFNKVLMEVYFKK